MTVLQSRRSGVLLHITSLPGPHGSGDFGPSAYRFVDWLNATGQSIWQLLPVTPIGPGNSPYQGVSAFAGNPWLVALEPLVAKGWLKEDGLSDVVFPADQVDYGRVLPWREQKLREAAKNFFDSDDQADQEAFAAWCKNQAAWLGDYALFMALKTANGGQPWWSWDKGLSRRDPDAISEVRGQMTKEIDFWCFVQWCFEAQLAALKSYANERGVSIMGDMPIFVAHDSVECWSQPENFYFDENFQTTVVAGVPPDAMSPTGQRWGNPLYRWDRMVENGFAWWIDRLQRTLSTADLVRIDHFRGFAAYYEIPADSVDATTGRWVDAPGDALFSAIEDKLGKLPIVAEDLGLITPDVVELRQQFHLPGMKILQFGFGGDGSHEFLPHNYEVNSVAYTGTHDNDTALGWWTHTNERERVFAGSYLAAGGHDIHWAMIRAACNSVSIAVVFPLQDVLGLGSSHRMNVPGTLDDNWSWRFEWKMISPETTRVLGLITAASGRGPIVLLGLPA
ncbi:MAG: 4-alpha-glucanotransferase [Rhodocyclaceae bacterium]|nr:4-alpha-glucanotransferase [Rhodocyclaceae bacterium]